MTASTTTSVAGSHTTDTIGESVSLWPFEWEVQTGIRIPFVFAQVQRKICYLSVPSWEQKGNSLPHGHLLQLCWFFVTFGFQTTAVGSLCLQLSYGPCWLFLVQSWCLLLIEVGYYWWLGPPHSLVLWASQTSQQVDKPHWRDSSGRHNKAVPCRRHRRPSQTDDRAFPNLYHSSWRLVLLGRFWSPGAFWLSCLSGKAG